MNDCRHKVVLFLFKDFFWNISENKNENYESENEN